MENKKSRKSVMSTDKDLVKKILCGMTKEPITRDTWIQFVKSNYTSENTNFLLDAYKYTSSITVRV